MKKEHAEKLVKATEELRKINQSLEFGIGLDGFSARESAKRLPQKELKELIDDLVDFYGKKYGRLFE